MSRRVITALRTRLADEELAKLQTYFKDRGQAVFRDREAQNWYTDRETAERLDASKFDDRKSGSGELTMIFDRSNLSLEIVRSVKTFLRARLMKDLFGSEPWFAVRPQGKLDKALAKQIEPHSRYKLAEARYVQKARETIDAALTYGECAVLTTWKEVTQEWEELVVGAVDTSTGTPIEGAPAPTLEEGAMEAENAAGGEAPEGEPAPEVDGQTSEYRENLARRSERVFAGLDFTPLYYKDVAWPMNVPDLESGDVVVWRYDARVSALRSRFAKPEFQDDANGESQDDANGESQDEELEEILESLKTESEQAKSDGARAATVQGETDAKATIEDPVVKIMEGCVEYVFPDGQTRRVWVVMAEDRDKIIWTDYLANISPRAAYPIHLVTTNKVKNRAYGVGLYKYFERHAEAADRLLNGILYRNSYNADPAKFWNPHMVEGAKGENKNLTLGPGKTFTLSNASYKASDALEVVILPDLDDRTHELMQLFMQLIQAESGVTNAAQSAVSALPGNDLATGINAMTEVSSVLHQYFLEVFRDDLKRQLGYALELLYTRQDQDETYDFLEGDASEVLTLVDAQTLSKLRMNVEILLTRSKRQEQREAAMAAIPIGVQWDQLPPQTQMRMQPAFVQAFQGLGFDHAEEFFPTLEQLAETVLTTMQLAGYQLVPPAPQPMDQAAAGGVPADPAIAGQGGMIPGMEGAA